MLTLTVHQCDALPDPTISMSSVLVCPTQVLGVQENENLSLSKLIRSSNVLIAYRMHLIAVIQRDIMGWFFLKYKHTGINRQ